MRRLFRAAIVLTLAAVVACGGGQPPSSPPPSSGGETITGRERLGWSQSAATPAELALYQYAVYVDGVRRTLEGVSCGPVSGTTSDCTAALPSLTAGTHTLQVAAFFSVADTVIEGSRSALLQVTVTGIATPPAGETPESGSFVSSDGLHLVADVLARDLEDPVDVAVDHERRVFVAERRRGIRIVNTNDAATVTSSVAPNLGRDQPVTFVSLTLGTDFDRSRAVYLAYATVERDQPALRVARFREVRGQLAEAAVITTQPAETVEAPALIRFAPDGTLFLGMAAETNPDEAQRLASPAGKVLRLRADGSTPDENRGTSPVFSYGHRDPRGLAWHALGTLWEIERGDADDEINVLQPGGNYGWPITAAVDERVAGRMPGIRSRIVLDGDTEPSGLTTIHAAEHPMNGDLIVAAAGARDLLRIRLTPDGQRQSGAAARLLQGRFGRVAQVTADSDGMIYFLTANRDTWGPGKDMLVRLSIAR